MRYDIVLNGNKYIVEIDDTKAKILQKETVEQGELLNLDVPDFDFGEDHSNDDCIKALLPGMVVSVRVQKGDHVQKGDTLVVVESMKMENAITAPIDCVIEQIPVAVGSHVKKGQELIKFYAEDGAV